MEPFDLLLKNASIFDGIPENEICSVLQCLAARQSRYPKDDYLLRPGDRVEEAGLLLKGSLLVLQEDFWGNRNLVARIGPGDVFAEAFASVPGSELTVSVMADEPCAVLWLNVGRLLTVNPDACSFHHRLIRNLLVKLAEKNLQFSEKLTHMGQRTTRQKLLSFLSAEAQRQHSPDFTIAFNRQQLADYLSVERSAMSAELAKLRDAGVLNFEKNHFTLYISG